MSGIEIKGLTKSYGKKTVLDSVDLSIRDGEFICLLGPSGCGKTTLLRSIAGLESPEEGSISLGTDVVYDTRKHVAVPPDKRDIGMVFQSFALWPHKSVFENVAYPLLRRGVKGEEAKTRVADALELVDLQGHHGSYPQTLSGGQQQRVALARAIVPRPRLLLLDEPLASLDANLRAHMRRELRELQQRLGATAVYVTHDKEDAGGLADRVYVLQDGNIVQTGAPSEVFSRPATAFVAEFVGFDNFLAGEVLAVTGGNVDVRLSEDTVLTGVAQRAVRPGDRVTVATRARGLTLNQADASVENAMHGTVHSIADLGDDFEVVVTDGQLEVVTRVVPSVAGRFQVGDAVLVTPNEGSPPVVLTDSRKSIGSAAESTK